MPFSWDSSNELGNSSWIGVKVPSAFTPQARLKFMWIRQGAIEDSDTMVAWWIHPRRKIDIIAWFHLHFHVQLEAITSLPLFHLSQKPNGFHVLFMMWNSKCSIFFSVNPIHSTSGITHWFIYFQKGLNAFLWVFFPNWFQWYFIQKRNAEINNSIKKF